MYEYMSKCEDMSHVWSHVTFIPSYLTLPIITLAAFQDLSLGILEGGDNSTITAAVTLTAAGGGLPNDFNSVKLAYEQIKV